MKKTILILLAPMLLSLAPAILKAGEMVPLNWSASKITWVGKKVLGEHTGTVKIKELTLATLAKDSEVIPMIDPDRPAHIVIDMTTIEDSDLKESDDKAKLVGHLKSEDFFDVAKFPTAEIVIKAVVLRDQQQHDGFTHNLKGQLTIKKITHDVVIPAKIIQNKNEWKAFGKLVVDRTQYDIRYRSGKFFEGLGDKIIKDEFEIAFDLTVSPKL